MALENEADARAQRLSRNKQRGIRIGRENRAH